MADYDYNTLSANPEATDNGKNYRDPTSLPELPDEIKNGQKDSFSKEIATWIRQKMYGIDVREALARAVEYFTVLYYRFKTGSEALSTRQDSVEQRQSRLETQMVDTIKNATADSEVINARRSENFGYFNLLDDRLENIENLLARYVPDGFSVKIFYNLARNPVITAKFYQYAIGTETAGLGTGPDGTFGGSAVESIPVNVDYQSGYATVKMPANYKQVGTFTVVSQKEILLIDGINVIKFEIEAGATSAQIVK